MGTHYAIYSCPVTAEDVSPSSLDAGAGHDKPAGHGYGWTREQAQEQAGLLATALDRLAEKRRGVDDPHTVHSADVYHVTQTMGCERCGECGRPVPVDQLTPAVRVDVPDVWAQLLCVDCHLGECGERDIAGGYCENCLPHLYRDVVREWCAPIRDGDKGSDEVTF